MTDFFVRTRETNVMHVIKSNVQMFEFCKNRKWSVVLIHSYLNFEGKCQKPC